MLSRWFRGGNAGGGKVQSQDDDRAELVAKLERRNREIGDFERMALNASTECERLRAELEAGKKSAKALRKVIAEQAAQASIERQQQRHDMMIEIIRLGERCTSAISRSDTATANFEWMRVMFNKGEMERSILMSRILEKQLQPFAVEREAATPRPVTDGSAGPTPPATQEGVDRPRTTAAMETAIGGVAGRFGVTFEDVGDDEAKALGIDHEADA